MRYQHHITWIALIVVSSILALEILVTLELQNTDTKPHVNLFQDISTTKKLKFETVFGDIKSIIYKAQHSISLRR
jgi:desulfoferrodoxin (superoxide reductase-like protein)